MKDPLTHSPQTIAMCANWYLLKQRPHHFVDAMNECGRQVNVYACRGLRSRGPRLAKSNQGLDYWLLPARWSRSPPISTFNQMQERRMLRHFLANPADCHVFARAPGPPLNTKPAWLIYDCMDDWAGFPGAPSDVLEREQELCQMADSIWVVSQHLESRLSRFAAKVQYVPNGVNFDHFASVPSMKQAAKPQPGRPVLGYVGALYSWFDAALVGKVARLLKDWSIVLIGPIGLTTRQRRELDCPNIELRGSCPYDALPAILAEMDVAMIPFCMNDLTKGTSPIKLYEYLAAALPVAATPMPEVLSFVEAGVVACADSPATFTEAVKQLFNDCKPHRCQDIARQHSWRKRFAEALGRPSEQTVQR